MVTRRQHTEQDQLTERKTSSKVTKGFAEGVERSETSAQEFVVAEEVQNALHKGTPVVALESAIITHGMPYPVNLELARELEDIVRKGSAVPATTAIVSGKVRVGLSTSELEMLARAKWVKKIGPRDIPVAVAMGFSGGTTVAASLHIADAAGIRVFVTGGIGGVHRGVSEVLDISQDLPTIGRSHCINRLRRCQVHPRPAQYLGVSRDRLRARPRLSDRHPASLSTSATPVSRSSTASTARRTSRPSCRYATA